MKRCKLGDVVVIKHVGRSKYNFYKEKTTEECFGKLGVVTGLSYHRCRHKPGNCAIIPFGNHWIQHEDNRNFLTLRDSEFEIIDNLYKE